MPIYSNVNGVLKNISSGGNNEGLSGVIVGSFTCSSNAITYGNGIVCNTTIPNNKIPKLVIFHIKFGSTSTNDLIEFITEGRTISPVGYQYTLTLTLSAGLFQVKSSASSSFIHNYAVFY